jgi:hypothetical protein
LQRSRYDAKGTSTSTSSKKALLCLAQTNPPNQSTFILASTRKKTINLHKYVSPFLTKKTCFSISRKKTCFSMSPKHHPGVTELASACSSNL